MSKVTSGEPDPDAEVPPSPEGDSKHPGLLKETVDYVYRQSPVILLTNAILAALVVWIEVNRVSGYTLPLWFFGLGIITIARYSLYVAYRRFAEEHLTAEQWQHLFSVLTILGAGLWGTAGWMFYSETSPLSNVFLAFVIGGMVAGAATSLAPLKWTLRGFVALVCGPVALRFLQGGDQLSSTMGIMFLVYGGAYIFVSANIAKMMRMSISLRHENLREIEVRREAERELMKTQRNLEKTVTLRTAELERANAELSREMAEREIVQSRLRESERRHRSLIDSSNDWIWETDADGTCEFSSPSVLSNLGYVQSEVLGRDLLELMPQLDSQELRANLKDENTGARKVIQVVNRFLHKDGTERFLESNIDPIIVPGRGLVGFRGISRDVTLRIRNEEEQRRVAHLESLGVLAGGIAHDFNNLLTAIFANIQLAQLSLSADSRGYRSLQSAVGAMEETRKLTDQLLTFARGGSPLLQSTRVEHLVVDACRIEFSNTDVRVSYNLADDLWLAKVDSGQISQVLGNLLKNAHEAMPGGGELKVTARNTAVEEGTASRLAPGRYVELSITDTGVGIARHDLPRVFDPYFSTKMQGAEKGTGIGLAVCYSIIEKHRGQISLDSEEEKGTTVTLFLPVQENEALCWEEDERPSASRPQNVGRVLLLEDDESVRNVEIRALEQAGYTVGASVEGVEIVRRYEESMAQKEPYDFVILDLVVKGGMGGLETLKRLKRIDPNVKAIAVSGYSDDHVMINARAYGFQAALPKPFRMAQLKALLVSNFS